MTLEPRGDKVLMTVIHSRLPNRGNVVGVSAGWHAHLDVLSDAPERPDARSVLGRADPPQGRLRPAPAGLTA